MDYKQFNSEKLDRKFTKIKKAFKSYDEFELQGREFVRKAIVGCYDIYLHYNEKLIRERCKSTNISYKSKKPIKMILMLALNVSDECDNKRLKARIQTYIRVLKKFKEFDYDTAEAAENLNKFGIDYFANKRLKEDNWEFAEAEDDYDDENQLELDFGDTDEINIKEDEEDCEANSKEDDDDEISDNIQQNFWGNSSSLEIKTLKFFQSNNIKDTNYIIWVNGDKVSKSTASRLLSQLNDSDFTRL